MEDPELQWKIQPPCTLSGPIAEVCVSSSLQGRNKILQDENIYTDHYWLWSAKLMFFLLQWGSTKDLLAVSTVDEVFILSEQVMSGHYSEEVRYNNNFQPL